MNNSLRHGLCRILSLSGPLIFTSVALAHRPTFSAGSATDANSAYEIKEPDVSQVVYHELTDDAQHLWLTFQGDKDYMLFVQIGVPVLDRLKDYRPAVVLLGPGLPEVELPFGIPEGLGGKVINTDDVTEPRFFHERFTDTRSWILKEVDVSLPASGRYFLVAYHPTGEPGKVWVSVGKLERFGLGDLLQFREWTIQARRFHEEVVGLGLPRIPCFASSALMLTALCVLASGLFASRAKFVAARRPCSAKSPRAPVE